MVSMDSIEASENIGIYDDKIVISPKEESAETWLSIMGSDYVLDLEIEFENTEGDFNIIIDNGKSDFWGSKSYQVFPSRKSNIVLNIDGNGDKSKIYFQNFSNLQETVKIDNLKIDNTFDFNWSRFYLCTSVMILLCILILFRSFFISKIHVAFFIIALVFGMNIINLMPNYFNFDEKEHFVKAYQIASFDFALSNQREIAWPENIEKFLSYNGNGANFDTSDEKENYFTEFNINQYNHYQYISTTAESYMPTAYLPAAFGIFLAKLLKLPFWLVFNTGRFFTLISYISIMTLIIRKIPCYKKTFFVFSLLPTQIYTASSYSADPITNLSVLLVLSMFICMKAKCDNNKQVSKKDLIIFLGSIVLLCTCKITYIPFFLLIFLIPNAKIPSFFRVKKQICLGPLESQQKKNGLRTKYLLCIILTFVLLVSTLYSTTHGIAQWPVPNMDPKTQVLTIIMNPLRYLIVFINYIQNNAMTFIEGSSVSLAYSGNLPSVYSLMAICGLFSLAILDDSDTLKYKRSEKAVILSIIIISWGLVVTALYITFNSIRAITILGVQGRYFAPLIIPFSLLFKTEKIKTYFNQNRVNAIVISAVVCVLIAVVAKLFFMYSA
ncbi:Uncharacterized membrane protein [Eubacterium barkeri]|uniref:Uncharacterized membrane protein n=2 Tax=Eubacterium barkeri TaxID=1528 RepID=A0A1H3CF25_EUBBA|nr:Uncharacterized membrane protein [Eubacterium barkeri]